MIAIAKSEGQEMLDRMIDAIVEDEFRESRSTLAGWQREFARKLIRDSLAQEPVHWIIGRFRAIPFEHRPKIVSQT